MFGAAYPGRRRSAPSRMRPPQTPTEVGAPSALVGIDFSNRLGETRARALS
jgi:hypothetical protein